MFPSRSQWYVVSMFVTFKARTNCIVALKFDSQGNQCGVDDLPYNPPPRPYNWDPFKSRPNFEFVEHTYEGEQSAKPSVNHLLDILAAQCILDGESNPEGGFFGSHDELLAAIDAIELGPTSWNSFVVRYTGPVDDNSPSWKRQEYVVHARDIREAYHTTLGNRDLDGKFDTRPYKRWVKGQRTYSDLMSSTWAWKKAVSDCISSALVLPVDGVSARQKLPRILRPMVLCSC